MFQIQSTNINDLPIKDSSHPPQAGAAVTFEGRVRNHNEGHNVTSLEYQCYESMAIKEGNKILKETFEKFNIINAICVHREGHLQISDIAVWIKVYSKHRKEAFEACQYIIDKVKLRVPIWKKEHYIDKDPEWVACHRCMEHSHG